MTDRWGITLPLTNLSLPDHRKIVAEMAGLGYTDVWSAEHSGADAFVPLALAGEWGPTLRLGTAIVPAFTRGPAVMAMSAATMADAAPGRFVLGLGASSPAIVQAWNAIPFEEPFKHTRDMLRFCKAAMTGEKITEAYDTFEVTGFRMERPPAVPPSIVLAALRPGMLRLAASEADGAITNWLSAEDVRQIRGVVGPDTELIARIFVCVTEDADQARAIGRRMISSYLTVPVYAKFHEWLGRGELIAEMNRLWAAGDRKGANAVIPDEVVDQLIVHGTAEQCRAHIRRYVENGLTTPVIAALPTLEPEELVRVLAPTA
ncbi:MAG TPA: LLM class F420-dependent oxidoreductase [Streptosporangiaceae bacterium]|jgi:probable F420-dependent oxidoreductase